MLVDRFVFTQRSHREWINNVDKLVNSILAALDTPLANIEVRGTHIAIAIMFALFLFALGRLSAPKRRTQSRRMVPGNHIGKFTPEIRDDLRQGNAALARFVPSRAAATRLELIRASIDLSGLRRQ